MFQRSLNASIEEERNALFTPRSNRKRKYNSAATASGDLERSSVKRKPGTKTWTMGFICLGDNHATRTPTAIQKQILFKAGLGLKKVTLDLKDDENEVYKKIVSENGFPKLKDCREFELPHCIANCKILEKLKCSMSAKDLCSNVGQGKIYLRPIQKCLSVIPIIEQESNTIKEKFQICNEEFLLQELRKHIEQKHLFDSLPTYLSLMDEEDSEDDLLNVQLGSSHDTNEN